MAMTAADAGEAVKTAFIAAMKGQYGGEDSDYEDLADNLAVPIAETLITYIQGNGESDGNPIE